MSSVDEENEEQMAYQIMWFAYQSSAAYHNSSDTASCKKASVSSSGLIQQLCTASVVWIQYPFLVFLYFKKMNLMTTWTRAYLFASVHIFLLWCISFCFSCELYESFWFSHNTTKLWRELRYLHTQLTTYFNDLSVTWNILIPTQNPWICFPRVARSERDRERER